MIIKEEIKRYLQANENKNTMNQKLWNTAAAAVLRGKFIPLKAYLKKQEKSQINNLTLHLKELKKRTSKAQTDQKNGNDRDQSRNKQTGV